MKEKFKSTLSLFQFVLIAMFVVISVMLTAISSQVYAKMTDTMQNNSSIRTAYGFLTNRERDYGTSFNVENDMLIFEPNFDGQEYVCRIYLNDGQLMESLLPADYEFEIGSGEVIAEIDEFKVEQVSGKVVVSISDNGNKVEKILAGEYYEKDRKIV